MLFDPMLADIAMAAARKGPITVQQIIEMLSNQLYVAECEVYGYLSIEGDLIVLLAPVPSSPTILQVRFSNI